MFLQVSLFAVALLQTVVYCHPLPTDPPAPSIGNSFRALVFSNYSDQGTKTVFEGLGRVAFSEKSKMVAMNLTDVAFKAQLGVIYDFGSKTAYYIMWNDDVTSGSCSHGAGPSDYFAIFDWLKNGKYDGHNKILNWDSWSMNNSDGFYNLVVASDNANVPIYNYFQNSTFLTVLEFIHFIPGEPDASFVSIPSFCKKAPRAEKPMNFYYSMFSASGKEPTRPNGMEKSGVRPQIQKAIMNKRLLI